MDKIDKKKLKALRDILNHWDPIGVLPFEGGPKDEYDCFNPVILGVLIKNESEKDLIEALRKHMADHTGIAGTPEEIAPQIMKWWKARD